MRYFLPAIALLVLASGPALAALPSGPPDACRGLLNRPLPAAQSIVDRTASDFRKRWKITSKGTAFAHMALGKWHVVSVYFADEEPGLLFVRNDGAKQTLVNVWSDTDAGDGGFRRWAAERVSGMPVRLIQCADWWQLVGEWRALPK